MSTDVRRGHRVATIATWILIGLEVLAMGAAGLSKFSNPGLWQSMFEGWGYPTWFAFVIGAGEAALALSLLIPRLASYAASGLILIMFGALVTVLTHPGGQMGPVPPLVHIAVLTIILVVRWRVRRWA